MHGVTRPICRGSTVGGFWGGGGGVGGDGGGGAAAAAEIGEQQAVLRQGRQEHQTHNKQQRHHEHEEQHPDYVSNHNTIKAHAHYMFSRSSSSLSSMAKQDNHHPSYDHLLRCRQPNAQTSSAYHHPSPYQIQYSRQRPLNSRLLSK